MRRVGILTGGGDAPGLNAVIRAFVKLAAGSLRWDVVGIEDSFNGLLPERRRHWDLTPVSCQGLLQRGGTVLGTTNRGDIFAYPDGHGGVSDRSADVAAGVRDLDLEGLVVIGGDGTQAMGWRLMQEHGVNVVGVPKTIDNDLAATDQTFGFQSAVDVATEALDRLHTTAESHDRVMLLEVMGRDAGHIALHAGISGGADAILLPELPYDPTRVVAKIRKRQARGRPFSLIVVAEGALPISDDLGERASPARKAMLKKGGGAARIALDAIMPHLPGVEARITVLGHLQRGGSPVPVDRMLATRFGVGAVDLIQEGRWGEMVCLRNNRVEGVGLAEACALNRGVDLDGEIVRVARKVGVELGG